jgi:DUF2934 family protein
LNLLILAGGTEGTIAAFPWVLEQGKGIGRDKVQCRVLARQQVTEVIGASEKNVCRGHQRIAIGTVRTYFSELVYGSIQSPIGSRRAWDQEEQMTEAYRHDEIARLAYEFWERRSRPLGSPEIDWYAAESALGVMHSQEQFSLLSVRLEPEEGPYREP